MYFLYILFQGLVSLNGRPFLFIPKHNVVNVVNSQQSSIEGGEVSNPPSLFLVPCDPPPKQLGAKSGDPAPTQLWVLRLSALFKPLTLLGIFAFCLSDQSPGFIVIILITSNFSSIFSDNFQVFFYHLGDWCYNFFF